MKKYYAGIGARKTPKDIQEQMTRIAQLLESLGYTLRSGGADGADIAFEAGAISKEIYLPCKGFNGSNSDLYLDNIRESRVIAAYNLAQRFHPKWHILTENVKKLMTRNSFQVLGQTLQDKSDFIVCWTKDGGPSGGTGQALRIAKFLKIPIFNLQKSESIEKLHSFLLF